MKNYDLYKHTPMDTIKGLLDFCAKEYREKEAFAYQERKQNISISFKQFQDEVEAFGSFLFSSGYQACHLAVLGENSYEWILTYFSVTCGKNVIVPLDKDLEEVEIAELLRDSECRVLIFSDTYADVIGRLKETLSDIDFINMKKIPECVKRGQELLERGYGDFLKIKIEKKDLASIVYTSGTTGKSKGVMLTHGNFMTDLYAASCAASISGTSLLVLPLHHTFGLVAGVFSVMYYGYPLYINRTLKRLTADLKKAKPQNIFAVPLIVETLYKNIWITAEKQKKDNMLKAVIKISNVLRRLGIDLRKVFFYSVLSAFGGELDLIICGGAPLSTKLVKGMDDFGITVLNGYGITECAPIVAVNRNKFNIMGSVGLPLICNEVKIAENGEVLVKGENVMLGYYHNEAENEKVFAEGWFKTGDLGRVDEYGALHITGRMKNLIILGNGENISAEFLEEKIREISYVKEVITYGKDNMIVEEIYLDEEDESAKERIHIDIQQLNQTLPLVRNIGKVIIRDKELPKTTTKKIKRNYGG